uniref:NifU-like protein 4 n=1 Tax=Rhizophora mucronata TaxID=61149 RepID=A0A2P2LN39_RHIMU
MMKFSSRSIFIVELSTLLVQGISWYVPSCTAANNGRGLITSVLDLCMWYLMPTQIA